MVILYERKAFVANMENILTKPLCMKKELMIDEATAKRFVEAGIRCLKKVGFKIDGNEEFMSYLSAYGCIISGMHVDFPDAVIDEAMRRIEEYRRENILKNSDYTPPGTIELMASGQGLLWHDPKEKKLRSGTKEDLAKYSHMLDALHMGRTHPGIIPCDAPLKTAELHAFATIALNSRKPWRVSPYSAAIMPLLFRGHDSGGRLERGRNRKSSFCA